MLNQEVVYRNPIQAFIGVRIGEKENEESRRAVGGQERLLTESNPNWSRRHVHGMSLVHGQGPPVGVTAGRPRLAMSTSRGADRPGTTHTRTHTHTHIYIYIYIIPLNCI